MKKLIIILMALIAYSTHVFADKVSFTASAPDAVVVGEQFRLSYIVTTQKVKDFRAPSIKGFDVLMGPSRSQQSSTQIVNGNVTSTSSITFTYILMANNAGEYTIPGASIVADGDQMVSNSVKIKVLPQDQGGNSGQNNSSSGSIHSSSGTSVSNQDLFIMASASKTNVYEQEAFVLTYKIYTRESNLQLNNAKLPDFKGFHSQEIEMTTNARWTPEHYQGRNYYTTVYRQFVLFPQQSGKLYIDPAQFQMTIGKPVQSDDPFDAFFNGGSNVIEIKKNISTPKIAINVNPLPTGKPADFSGGVGEFNISSSINSKELKTNDAITIKLVISGTGNLKLISNPEIKFPDDFEVYDPKVDNQVRLTREGLTGNKVIEYLAIPRHAGTYKIPGVSFSYFDIRSKSYKTLKTEDYVVNVEKGAGNADQVIANFTNKEDLKVLGEDIRYIKQNEVTLQPKGSFFYGSMTYWLFYIIPALAFIIFFIIYRKQAAENANVAKMRTKKANKVATKRMKLAGKLLSENKKDAFYDEVLKALWGYISDKLNIPVSRLSKDNIEEKLRNHGVNEELIKEFLNALNDCEFARFAPGDENQAMDKVYSSSIEVISKMENSRRDYVMKKILFFILLSMSLTCFGQDSLSIDTRQTNGVDSIHASHTTFSSNTLEDATKAEGDSAYIKEDYAAAIQIYEALLKNGEAADVYYNLGNSYYKIGEIAKAVLNYERALLLQPGNGDIRANLEVARAKTIDKVEPVPEVFFVSWIKSLTNSMSVDAWATWGIVSFILLIIAFYFFIFSKQIMLKKIGFISGIILLIVTVCSNLFASQQKEHLVNRSEAIVMNPSVTVRSTPSESGTSLFILHEGRKVSVKDNSMKEWKEIRLEDGKVGWVPASAIEVI